jgi:hypothetical protein
MVNGGLKSRGVFDDEIRSAAGLRSKRNLAAKAALTNQTIAVRCHQKLFWPSRFMVY